MCNMLFNLVLVVALSFGGVVKSEYLPYGWESGPKRPAQDEMSRVVDSMHPKNVIEEKPRVTHDIPAFTYTVPKPRPESQEDSPFAVGPSDPRFYQDFAASESLEDRYRELLQELVSDFKSDLSTEKLASKGFSPIAEIRQVSVTTEYDETRRGDLYFTAFVAGCSAAAIFALIGLGVAFYRLLKSTKAAEEVDYPAYGVTGPNKDISPISGDGKLAHSAQMYHYQHQKQQILAMSNMADKGRQDSASEVESEEENEEGDYTVYECPGLASTGEMEVKNPLFQDDQTPASKPAKESGDEAKELPK